MELPADLTNRQAGAILDVVMSGMKRARDIADDIPSGADEPFVDSIGVVEAAVEAARAFLVGKEPGAPVLEHMGRLISEIVTQAESIAGALDLMEPALETGKQVVAAVKTAAKTGLALPLALFGKLGWVLAGAGVLVVIVGGVLVWRALR